MNEEEKVVLELAKLNGIAGGQISKPYAKNIMAFTQAIRDQEAAKHKAEVAELERKVAGLRDALIDARSGFRYIRDTYGELYGVGFDRIEHKSTEAINYVSAQRERMVSDE